MSSVGDTVVTTPRRGGFVGAHQATIKASVVDLLAKSLLSTKRT